MYRVLIPMWWGGFSELEAVHSKPRIYCVLIPMWWGGFSEEDDVMMLQNSAVLIPMWWGGFSEAKADANFRRMEKS